ncbi:MAG: T9SS type A sorting domain-containing protein, partial [Flavobacteriia bacterium]|nr:T9SS type A sorting domain-containing protein [Flavobacteriia bacterium]
DDIGIWNRALTDCEIQNLYSSTYLTNTTSSSACDSYVWNGTSYSASGVYTGTTSNCVTESLNLNITPSSTNTTTAATCESYIWNGTTYSASGVYTGTTTNCVTEFLNLTITPSSTITQPASQSTNISNNAQFIVGSSGSNAIYQWQTNLGFGFQNLNNAGQYNGTTSSTLSVLNLSMSNNNQVFRCIISSGSCTDTSAVAVLTVVNNAGINNINASKHSIYPNPTNGDFTITGLELVGTVSSLTLTDINGKIVKVLDTKATKFTMASIKPGVYFLNIRADNKQEVLKIVKE